MSDTSVEFPKPCGENWDDMAPEGCNRHCASCDKTIHDLSSMTLQDAETLLDTEKEACVRAAIQPDGTVSLADSSDDKSRRMIALVGATLSLATAACQTSPMTVSPRYEITGKVGSGIWASKATLEASTGKRWSTRIDGDRQFSISNLHPGIYSLSFTGTCGEIHKFENIVVRDSDLDTGMLEPQVKEECIIIGVFQRTDRNGRG